MTTWKQERPSWCPHKDCRHIYRVQDSVCGGWLPKSKPHDGYFNDQRLCLRFKDDGEIIDMQVNKSDLWWFDLLLKAMRRARNGVE